MKKKSKVLQDHKQKKKVLVPPLLHAMGDKHKWYSWVKELIPELFWIAILQKKYGFKQGVEIAKIIGQKAGEVCGKTPSPMFANASSFLELSETEKSALLEGLVFDGHIESIRDGLRSLIALIPSYPLNFLFEEVNEDDEVSPDISDVLEELYDRASVTATHTQAAAIYLGFTQDKIKIAVEQSPLANFEEIENYPDTEASKELASSLRAMSGLFLTKNDTDIESVDTSWVEQFWTKVSGLGQCLNEESSNFYGEDQLPEDELGRMVFRFCNSAKTELHERIEKWGFDLNEAEKYEVVGALLARLTSLAVDLAMSPMSWTPSASPLFHRAMADVYITLSWIFKEPQERSLKFIETGIGDVKLDVAHRKNRMKDELENDPKDKKMIELLEQWISSQRLAELVEVNLSGWSGITTRKMAEEADCLDFYNYVYQPFSAAVHSSWVHVSMHNLKYCENPAHRGHRLPVSIDYDPSPDFLYLSAKYLQKAFAKFDEETGIKTSSISAFDQLYEDIYGVEEDNEQ